jgi:CDP-4-dehydro-6-deoxyglucose reductase, E1
MKTNELIEHKKFNPGEDWVWYAPNTKDIFSEKEIGAVTDALRKGWLTTGSITASFEKEVAQLFGKKDGLFVNSGSSANLLSFAALDLPKGSEVITAACNFNTTVAPIIQSGLVPVFIDVKPGYYTFDVALLEQALTKKTKAIIAPHLIGNLVDLTALRTFAKAHNLVVIEDSCDTIDSTWKGEPTGKYTDITTTSFYASHIITTAGAGGMVMLNNKALRERARVFRDWGRGITKHDDKIRSRLGSYKINKKPYDSAFVFVEQGYNMRPTEVQAAFGLAQLERLHSFTATRERNFNTLYKFFSKYEDHFILPQHEPHAKVNWLAFPLTIRKNSSIERNTLVQFLEDRKIQTRPLFSGNIMKHPAYKKSGRAGSSLANSDHVLSHSFLIGAHHGMTEEMTDYMCGVLDSFMLKK